MVADPARRASSPGFAEGDRRDRRRGLSGLLVAGVAFAATFAAGLYVVELVRDFGTDEIAAIKAAGEL
ncbi:hypothetical protein [Alienimonas chondri]|uniref:Uncharacterized protein n=1 Tax=Alienimonas chondri TaxID=2681879 RepID=A0ABX1VCN2_9PLAN|nr:hypothetical protein [Alienimonas chondri]NNJ25706.1 hypothetical protein [Alienimonas chondri]